MPDEKRAQEGDGQTSWEGMERRRPVQEGYKGEERRKVNPEAQMPGGNPQGGNPGQGKEDPTE